MGKIPKRISMILSGSNYIPCGMIVILYGIGVIPTGISMIPCGSKAIPSRKFIELRINICPK
jgi:hypothetical protein